MKPEAEEAGEVYRLSHSVSMAAMTASSTASKQGLPGLLVRMGEGAAHISVTMT